MGNVKPLLKSVVVPPSPLGDNASNDNGNSEDVNYYSNDNFSLVHLGEVDLKVAGAYDLRIEFETPGINLDWFFSKRVSKGISGCDG